MEFNLHTYCRLLACLRQLLPSVRITQVRLLALMVAALPQSHGVHLRQIACVLPGSRAQMPSVVSRLQRFVSNRRIVPWQLYRPLGEQLLASYAGGEVRLVMDVTQAGRFCRMLTVNLACRKRTLLLAWRVYAGVKGGVAVAEQIALLEQVASWLPANSRVLLVADAGFEAADLVRWLMRHNWRFVLRRPGEHKVRLLEPTATDPSGWVRLEHLPATPGATRQLGRVLWTEKAAVGPLWLTLHWGKGESEPWYLLASDPDPHTAVRHYARRMWTEQTYGDLKRHGFHLQSSHLRHPDRLERLVLVLAIAYAWLLALGTRVVKRGLRRRIDHKSRRDLSYFRLGYDWTAYCQRLDRPIALHFVPYS